MGGPPGLPPPRQQLLGKHLAQPRGVHAAALQVQVHLLDQLLGPRDPSQPKPRGQHLAKGVQAKDPTLCVQAEVALRLGVLRGGVEVEKPVRVILHHQKVVAAGQRVDLLAALGGRRGPAGVLPCWDRVQHLCRGIRLKNLLQGRGDDTMLVRVHRSQVASDGPQRGECAAVGGVLHQNVVPLVHYRVKDLRQQVLRAHAHAELKVRVGNVVDGVGLGLQHRHKVRQPGRRGVLKGLGEGLGAQCEALAVRQGEREPREREPAGVGQAPSQADHSRDGSQGGERPNGRGLAAPRAPAQEGCVVAKSGHLEFRKTMGHRGKRAAGTGGGAGHQEKPNRSRKN
eukprot:RCo048679